jgi:predicted GNAT family acetyltransferase
MTFDTTGGKLPRLANGRKRRYRFSSAGFLLSIRRRQFDSFGAIAWGMHHDTGHTFRESCLKAAGRYVARIAGTDGEIFTIHGPTLISAEHTHAPESMRGTGAAAALVEHMISHARANGFKVNPICPYVQAQYKRHPE